MHAESESSAINSSLTGHPTSKAVDSLTRLTCTVDMPPAAINSFQFLTECQLKNTESHSKHLLLLKLFISCPSHKGHQQSLGLCVTPEKKSLVSSYPKVFPLTR